MQYTITMEDMNIILKGLAALPLGESMSTFQRIIQQVQQNQKESGAMTVPPNGKHVEDKVSN
jgi:hypothetical protein